MEQYITLAYEYSGLSICFKDKLSRLGTIPKMNDRMYGTDNVSWIQSLGILFSRNLINLKN
jgi:hypothetical protein